MHNKRCNYYGILLSILLIAVLIGLLTSKQPTTGFATKATQCFDGTEFGECSFLKPKYCDNGALKPNCQKCGCSADEVCQDDGTCLQKCADGTLFGYCSENKPLLCFKGTLLENCFKCGCFPGQTCLQNGTCAGNIEVGAGAEEKKELIEEPEEELEVKEKVIEVKEAKEAPKVGFLWNFFCKVFYFDEYEDCIADVIRKQNK